MHHFKTILTLFLVSIFALTSCDMLDPGPEPNAQIFLQAMKFGDIEKAKSVTTEETHNALIMAVEVMPVNRYRDQEFTITKIEREGDYATVYYQVEGTDKTRELNMKKDPKKGWLVIFDKAGGLKELLNSEEGEFNIQMNGKPESIDEEYSEKMKELFEEMGEMQKEFEEGFQNSEELTEAFTESQEEIKEIRDKMEQIRKEEGAEMSEDLQKEMNKLLQDLATLNKDYREELNKALKK